MSWIDLVGGLFGPSRFKAVTDNLWMMIKELKEESARQRVQIQDLQSEVHTLQRAEEDCQRRIIPLLKENNDLREELIFKTKRKS